MTSTLTSHAEVATGRPVPYMRQLCKHFGHKLAAEFGPDSGYIEFDAGRCDLLAAEGELRLVVSAEEAEDLKRLREVVGSHLERFGRRDELSVTWR
ncbi:MAG: DUF2218 domain-containing protein [Solirubrobacteraceae bacterium]